MSGEWQEAECDTNAKLAYNETIIKQTEPEYDVVFIMIDYRPQGSLKPVEVVFHAEKNEWQQEKSPAFSPAVQAADASRKM